MSEGAALETPEPAAASPAPASAPHELVVSAGAIAGGGTATLFLLLRLGLTWQAPVGGAELDHLSGAWQASLGVGDDCFVATLFQALTAGLFQFTTSEVPARVLAFLATATVPVAIYLLRPRLGNGGALLALLLLAIDPANMLLGVTASAMALDVAIAAWLLVLLDRLAQPPWAWAVAGFAVSMAGPIPLSALAAAALGVALWRRDQALTRALAWMLPGAVLGVLVASFRYGLGAEHLVVAPFRLFADGYERPWLSGTAGDALLLLGLFLFAGGLAAWGVTAWRWGRTIGRDPFTLILLAWSALSLAWLLSSLGSHSLVPVAGVLFPLSLLLGPALAAGIGAMARADWRLARFVLPAAAVLGLIAMAYVLKWARAEQVNSDERPAVALLFTAAVGLLAIVAASRRSAPTLLAAALFVAAFPTLAGTTMVALSGTADPSTAPRSPQQAGELRELALQAVAAKGGTIVVHPRYAEEITWLFRDSVTLLVSSRVPPDATFVIWPPELAKPPGFQQIEGQWRLGESIDPPTGGLLEYLHWFIDRNHLAIRPEAVSVYSRATE